MLPAGNVALTCLLACPKVHFLPSLLPPCVVGDHCIQSSVLLPETLQQSDALLSLSLPPPSQPLKHSGVVCEIPTYLLSLHSVKPCPLLSLETHTVILENTKQAYLSACVLPPPTLTYQTCMEARQGTT